MKMYFTGVCVLAFLSSAAHANWNNESEAGLLLARGNSKSESYTFKQLTGFTWEEVNTLKFSGRYLQTKTNNLENARFWSLGLRFDRAINERLGMYVGELVESDKYAGYNQKYNSDIGAKYSLIKEEKFLWNLEAGYRYTIEKPFFGADKKMHYARGYTEVQKLWNESVTTKIWFEYLPNLTTGSDYQMNSELSLSAALNNMFALKTGYLLRYDNLPNPNAVAKTDTLLTTSLVAKF